MTQKSSPAQEKNVGEVASLRLGFQPPLKFRAEFSRAPFKRRCEPFKSIRPIQVDPLPHAKPIRNRAFLQPRRDYEDRSFGFFVSYIQRQPYFFLSEPRTGNRLP